MRSEAAQTHFDETVHRGNLIYERFKRENKELADIQNELAKEWFLDPQNIDSIAKAVTMCVFRDGPVENVHNKCKDFTDEAMKEIIIFMVNHIAGLLSYALDGKWLELRALTAYFNVLTKTWNPAEADTDVIDYLFCREINTIKTKT